MIEVRLNIGELYVSSSPTVFTCFGLGSCVGLFLQDRSERIAGAAHIFLPEPLGEWPNHETLSTVEGAFKELLVQFENRGSSLKSLRAKIVGGASVTSSARETGKRNSEAILSLLRKHHIYVAAVDVGGRTARTASFNSGSGELKVKKIDSKEVFIF
jgi:chemotaxis protein CheD